MVENIECLICNEKPVSKEMLKYHLKTQHGLKWSEYCKKFKLYDTCKWCGQTLKSFKQKNFCCLQHRKIFENNEKFKNDPTIPTCRICGMKSHSLTTHITRVHKLSIPVYIEKFNLSLNDCFSDQYRKFFSEKIKGDKNPGYQHGGKLSHVSKNFIKYEKLSDEETERKIQLAKEKNKRNKLPEDDNTKEEPEKIIKKCLDFIYG